MRVSHSIPKGIHWELIMVDEFKSSGLRQIAEKNEAKLFIRPNSSLSQKFEVGAFQATGDIFYFLMPGYIPPLDFGSRIIRAGTTQSDLGTIPKPWIRVLCSVFPLKIMEKLALRCMTIDNLIISKKLFKITHGLRFDGEDRNFLKLLSHPMAESYKTLMI